MLARRQPAVDWVRSGSLDVAHLAGDAAGRIDIPGALVCARSPANAEGSLMTTSSATWIP